MATTTRDQHKPQSKAGKRLHLRHQKPRLTPAKLLRTTALYTLLTLVAAVFVGPFLILLSSAIKPSGQPVYSFPPDLIPRPPVIDWFIEAWTVIPFLTFLNNSLIYIAITIPIYLLVSAMTAYPLALMKFRSRKFLFIMFLSTMFLPGELMLIPRFLVMSELNLTDTYAAVILPAILSGVGIFLLRQTFASIPREMIDAARIDGCNEWRVFWNIALPSTRPTLAVLAILGFISVWNSFVWPLVVLSDQDKFPLSLGIAYLAGISGTDVRGLAAGTVLSIIPILIIFLILQRQILNGMSGAVKG